MKTNRHILALTGLLFAASSANADEYHNINGFFGERAAGLGGAYTAIADDPSGAVYNPAGLAFAYDNYISISASTYRETKKVFEGVFGPGQDFLLQSRSYLPNFLGAIKSYGDLKFAFSIVNPATDSFDQADQVNLPFSLPEVSSYRNELTRDDLAVHAGPSLAWSLSDRFSIGGTLYYTYDTSRLTFNQLVQGKAGAYTNNTTYDRRRTMGFLPVLGLQYMPSDELSLGLSVRRPVVTSKSRRVTNMQTNSAATDTTKITLMEGTQDGTGLSNESFTYMAPPKTGSVPESPEVRAGAAYFVSRYLLLSLDLIHTGAFRATQDNTTFAFGKGAFDGFNLLVLGDSEIRELSRQATNNLAFGLEYYLTDNMSLRGGYYTNYSNNSDISWLEANIATSVRSQALNQIQTLVGNTYVVYNIPMFDALTRNEYVDTFGYSLGFAWETAKSSISLTAVVERGRGQAQIASSLVTQPLSYRSFAFYAVASTRN